MTIPKFKFRKTKLMGGSYIPYLDGKPYEPMIAAELLVAAGYTEQHYRNHRTALTRAINRPGGLIETDEGWMPFMLLLNVSRVRLIAERLMREAGAKLTRDKQRGGFIVKHGAHRTRIGRETNAMRTHRNAQRKLSLIDGQNPFELDGYDDLPDADRAVMTARSKFRAGGEKRADFRYDSGAQYRFGRTQHRLRTDQVRSRAAMLAAAKDQPLVARLILQLIAELALRADREACGLTMYCIHVVSGFDNPRLRAFNKGDGLEPSKDCDLAIGTREMLLGYIDGDRQAYDRKGHGLADYKELSRRAHLGDAEAERILRAEPVFLVRGGGRMTRANLMKSYLGPAFEAAGVPGGLHRLRHEYVHDRLREIEGMGLTASGLAAEETNLAKFMGWSGTSMLAVYDAYERWRRALEANAEFHERRERGVLIAQNTRVSPIGVGDVVPFGATRSSVTGTFLSIGGGIAA